MELGNKRMEESYKFDLTLSEREKLYLKQIGYELIEKDEQALINYAVCRIIEDEVKNLVK